MVRRMVFVGRGNLLLGLGNLNIDWNKLPLGLDIYWEEFNFA